MAARRRKTTKKTRHTIALSRKQFGVLLISVGVLYFFALFFAQNSPLVELAKKVFAVIIGAQGMHMFFALSIL